MKLRVDTGMRNAGPGREPAYTGRSTLEIVGDDGVVQCQAVYDIRIAGDAAEFGRCLDAVNTLASSPAAIHEVVEELRALPRMKPPAAA